MASVARPQPRASLTRASLTRASLTLASASPRRAELLRAAGIDVVVSPVACDETPHEGEVATVYARRIADDKLAAATSLLRQGRPVLTADTVVWRPHPPVPIGKPKDREDAARILRALCDAGEDGRGTLHRVTTAFAIAWPDGRRALGEATTVVWMRGFANEAELHAHLDIGEWKDKAGGYGIQGAAAGLVRRVEGSYTNVVGLPVTEVLEALRHPPERHAPEVEVE